MIPLDGGEQKCEWRGHEMEEPSKGVQSLFNGDFLRCVEQFTCRKMIRLRVGYRPELVALNGGDISDLYYVALLSITGLQFTE
jgi:hypothetical protein